ncbi:class E sortase [Geodermatophilus marinus]|uniref:class E sortase n=1 Tax=Geodermatophilus sp. LHW52908 TaxID=2303986 RepID=UPI000E3E072F|nr:class E sortase [Geodermatophilus sp. LHW52908]RFU20206.1 class E sortase [Geodermatophilus sp. LHW52908]
MIRRLVHGLSELAVTAGAVLLLLVVHEVWITDLFSDGAQEQVAEELREEWSRPGAGPAGPALGEGFAFLHVPRFGSDWTRAVVEGVDPAELDEGPGHYPGTAMPGEQGNFAMAGHRVGRGSPFLALDVLRPGDAVVVETADAWHVYRVTTTSVVDPSENRVVSPTPGGPPGGPPTGAFLTMTTCHPKFSTRERLVVHAELEGSVPRTDAPQGPAALQEV